jgi:riboflavin synthase alpha subunit
VSSGNQQVGPDVAFNADPNFEVGKSVTAGSFTINGTSISVSATDTLNTVLDRITASAAGVTATYDASTEQVTLTQKTAGSTPTITLGADTSGFLAAVKLTGAPVVPGTDEVVGLTGPMQDVAQLSGVTAGSITVNGVSIAIDPTTQSIYDVLDAIELNVPAVSAALNATTGKVILSSVSAGASFTIDSGTTGFFGALGIDDGTYEGRSGVSSRSSARATAALRDVREAFTELFDDAALSLDGTTRLPAEVPSLRSALATLVQQRFGTDTSLDTGFGLSFAFETSEGGSVSGSMDFGRSDEPAFSRAFRQRSRAVQAFFLQPMSSSGDGLIDRMLDTLADSRTSLKARADG